MSYRFQMKKFFEYSAKFEWEEFSYNEVLESLFNQT